MSNNKGSAHNNVELSELVENLYEMITVLSNRVYILEKEKDTLLQQALLLKETKKNEIR
tara:strand:+ start:2071 stop:2247 length:177 start_codon:yes stop_codon:yes gene_type:complete